MNTSKQEFWLKGLAVLATAAFVFIAYDAFRERKVEAGDTAPGFSIRTDNGREITRAAFGGKVLVLNFWATWCPPCLNEIPSLNQMARTLSNKGVVVLGVSVDKNQEAYKKFLAKNKLEFLTAHDPSAEISGEYGTFKYPETYIVNAEGKVLEKLIADQNWMDPQILQRLEGYAR